MPPIWKETIIILISKPGKGTSIPCNYGLTFLTSCICKLMEKMVNFRLKWLLEQERVLTYISMGLENQNQTMMPLWWWRRLYKIPLHSNITYYQSLTSKTVSLICLLLSVCGLLDSVLVRRKFTGYARTHEDCSKLGCAVGNIPWIHGFLPIKTMNIYFLKREFFHATLFLGANPLFCQRGELLDSRLMQVSRVKATKALSILLVISCLSWDENCQISAVMQSTLFVANLTLHVRLLHLQLPLFSACWSSQNLCRSFQVFTFRVSVCWVENHLFHYPRTTWTWFTAAGPVVGKEEYLGRSQIESSRF